MCTTVLHVLLVSLMCRNHLAAVVKKSVDLLPAEWTDMCQTKPTGNTSHIAIYCHLTHEDIWDLKDFRNWSASVNHTQIFVDIDCDSGGKVCLPWPYRADNLDTLKIKRCINVCYMDDFIRSGILETIPDTLRVFEGYDITVQTTVTDLMNVAAKTLPPSLDCGPQSIHTYIYQGAKTEFIYDVKSLSTFQDNITDILTSSVQDMNHVEHKCRYENMKVYDVSRNVDTSSSSLYTAIVNSYFPQLQTLNLSNTELQFFPTLLQAWRQRFPRLKTLDLSHNSISRFEISADFSLSSDSTWFINLTYNNIETIGSREMGSFKFERGFIDVRNNPIRCDCTMAEFSEYLRIYESPQAAGLNPKYSYLWTLACVTPQSLHGHKLAQISRQTLCNTDVTVYKTTIHVLVAAVVLLILIVLTIVIIQCNGYRIKKTPTSDNENKPTSMEVESVEKNLSLTNP